MLLSQEYSFQVIEEDESEIVCLVRRKDEPLLCKEINDDPIPNYLRTRQIVVKEVIYGDRAYIVVKCSCHCFTRKKCPCRHFYAIADRSPKAEDFSPECLKSYELYYGDDKQYTESADTTIEMIESCGGLVLRMTLEDFKNEMKEQHVNLDWYQSANNELGIDTTPRDDNLAKKLSSIHSSSAFKSSTQNTRTKKKSVYSRTNKSFLECVEKASSEEDVQDIMETLNALQGRILARKKRKSEATSSAGTVSSFPPLEKRNKVPRLEPRGSPRKS